MEWLSALMMHLHIWAQTQCCGSISICPGSKEEKLGFVYNLHYWVCWKLPMVKAGMMRLVWGWGFPQLGNLRILICYIIFLKIWNHFLKVGCLFGGRKEERLLPRTATKKSIQFLVPSIETDNTDSPLRLLTSPTQYWQNGNNNKPWSFKQAKIWVLVSISKTIICWKLKCLICSNMETYRNTSPIILN